MRGDEAKEVCPQIQLVQVPVARDKADLNTYRNAGSEVVSILARKGRCERASIDEVYLDLTDAAETMLMETPPESLEDIHPEVLKSHVLGLNNEDGSDLKEDVRKWLCRSDTDCRDKLLACGALIVAELRMQVLKETEFTCSAGIAHNKMLAKLASAMNKPAQQTVVPHSSVQGLLESFPIKKMKQLGGKLGSSLKSDLGVSTVGDLLQFSEEKLQQRYGINTGTWLWNIARGISGEEVEGRLLPKSHGSGKTFPGPQALKTFAAVQHWLNKLCEELNERLHSDLDQNKRIARTLTLHARAYKSGESDSHKKFPSKSCPLRYGTTKIQDDALNLFQAGLREYMGSYNSKIHGSQNNNWAITSLSVSASKIVPIPSGTRSIANYFSGQPPSFSSSKQSVDNAFQETEPLSPSGLNAYENEMQLDYPEEETRMKHVTASSDQQGPSCNLSSQGHDLSEESSLVSPPGNKIGMAQCELQREFPVDDRKLIYGTSSLKAIEKKRTAVKEKLQGNGSILKFFKNCHNSCSLEQKHVGNGQGVEGSSSVGSQSISETNSSSNQVELPKESPSEEIAIDNGGCSLARMQQGREAWSYKADEIDPSIIHELPKEFQEELWSWLRPHKRPNLVKRGSSITHYFSPNKNR